MAIPIGQRWRVFKYTDFVDKVPLNGEMVVLKDAPQFVGYNVWVIGNGIDPVSDLIERRVFFPVVAYASVASTVYPSGVMVVVTGAPAAPFLTLPLVGDGTHTVTELVADWTAGVMIAVSDLYALKDYDADYDYSYHENCFFDGQPYRSLVPGVGTNTGNQPDENPAAWEPVGGGSGVAEEPGFTLENGQFEGKQVLGWSLYKDAAQATPEDGTGGTAAGLTLSHDTAAPLVGSGSLLLTKAAVNAQGEGLSADITIDRGMVTGPAQVTLVCETGGSYADGDLVPFLRDKANSSWIPVSVSSVPSTYGKPSRLLLTFIPSTSTEYRLTFHVATASALAWTFMLDDVQVGPMKWSVGAAIGTTQAYPLTIGATTTAPTKGTVAEDVATWARHGDKMLWSYKYKQTAAGSAGSGTYLFPIRPGESIDMTKHPVGSVVGHFRGSTSTDDFGVVSNSRVVGSVLVYSSTQLVFKPQYTGYSDEACVGAAFFGLGNAVVVLSAEAAFTIAQWTSNVNLASDFTEYASNSDATATASVTTSGFLKGFGNFGTFGAWTVGTEWIRRIKFNQPIQWGRDKLSFGIRLMSTGETWEGEHVSTHICNFTYQNASRYGYSLHPVASDPYAVDVKFQSNGRVTNGAYSANGSAFSDFGTNWNWWVRKISNSNMAEVLPVVRAEYTNALAASSANPIVYSAKVEDTHSAYSGSTGIFTAPISGVYLIEAVVISAAALSYALYKGTSNYRPLGGSTAGGYFLQVQATVRLLAGETISVRPAGGSSSANSAACMTITLIGR